MKLSPIRKLVKKTKQITPVKLGRDSFVYIDISSIDKDSKAIVNPQYLSVDDAPSRARKEIRAEDVLVATVRPNLNGVAIVPKQYDNQIASTGFCVLRADKTALDPYYLFYFTHTVQFVTRLTKLSIGAGYPAVSDEEILDTDIPLPPLPEQQRIADLLARADRLRRLRRYAHQLGDTYLQSVFVEMFGEPGSNPKRWDIVKIRDVADIIVPTRDKPRNFTGDIPWITLPDLDCLFIGTAKNMLTREDAREVGNRLMPVNTVLLSCAGSLGKIAIAKREIYANQQFYGLVAKREFLNHIFLAMHLIMFGEEFYFNLAGISTLGFFSKDKALEINIMLPPLPEQERFAGVVQRYERLRAQQAEAERQAEMLFQSLLAQAFGGASGRSICRQKSVKNLANSANASPQPGS